MESYPKYIKKPCKFIKNTYNPIENSINHVEGAPQKRNYKQQITP